MTALPTVKHDRVVSSLVSWLVLHTVRAYADGEAFAHSTFTVTTLGAEFVRGLRQTHDIADFPAPSSQGAGGLDSCLHRNDGWLHRIVICSSPA